LKVAGVGAVDLEAEEIESADVASADFSPAISEETSEAVTETNCAHGGLSVSSSSTTTSPEAPGALWLVLLLVFIF
jgi:hypothetical protein